MSKNAATEDEIILSLRVPKSAFITIAPVPATVTQHTVEQHFGIPKRAYVRMLRDGLVPFKKIGRLKIAGYEDVRRAVTEGAVPMPKRAKEVTKPTFDSDKLLKDVDKRFAARVGRSMSDEELLHADMWIDISRDSAAESNEEYTDTADDVAAHMQSNVGREPIHYRGWRSLGLDPSALELEAEKLRARLYAEHPEMGWRERLNEVHRMWSAITEPLEEARRAEKAAAKAEKARLGTLGLKK